MSARTVLVTGATSGIGLATAELFAEKGWQLQLLARRSNRLDELSARLRKERGAEVETWTLDVRERAAVEAWAAENAESLARTEVLVNNAGLARGLAKLHEGDADDWDEMIDTNVKGLLYMSRAVIPHLVKRGSGHVVNVGSVAGRWVYPNGAAYCGSKHAERAINEGMRMDLCGSGVRVTTVDPGLVNTEFSVVRFHGDQEKADATYEGMTPLTGNDVAETITWIVERPAHVNVAEVVLYPTDQVAPTIVHRRI